MKSRAKTSTELPELEDIAEQIGEFIQHWGFKKIHGRIWTHLFLSKDPLDAGELIRRLKVSKALISMSLKDLLEYDVIQEVGRGRKGVVYYRASSDITANVVNVLRSRERRMLARMNASYRLLRDVKASEKEASKLDLGQVKALGDLIEVAESSLDSFIAMSEAEFDLTARLKEIETSCRRCH